MFLHSKIMNEWYFMARTWHKNLRMCRKWHHLSEAIYLNKCFYISGIQTTQRSVVLCSFMRNGQDTHSILPIWNSLPLIDYLQRLASRLSSKISFKILFKDSLQYSLQSLADSTKPINATKYVSCIH